MSYTSEIFCTKGINMEYSFNSIEEQESHFELTHDTFLRNDRAKYIAQQRISEIATQLSDDTQDVRRNFIQGV